MVFLPQCAPFGVKNLSAFVDRRARGTSVIHEYNKPLQNFKFLAGNLLNEIIGVELTL